MSAAPLHGVEFADERDDQRRVLCRIGRKNTRCGSASGFVIEADRRGHIAEVGVGLRHEVRHSVAFQDDGVVGLAELGRDTRDQ